MTLFGHPLHPMLVHFPIALLFTSVFFDVFGHWKDREFFRSFSLWLLFLGLIGAVGAAASGLLSEEPVVKSGVPESAIERHEFFALLSTVVFLVLLGFRWRFRRRWSVTFQRLNLAGSFLGLLFLSAAGYFGGELVFRHGAGLEIPVIRPAQEGGDNSPP